MQSRRLALLFAFLPLFSLVLCSEAALASAPYAISATNVTMPATGLGFTQYTVTGIPMTGTLSVTCQYAGTETDLKIPICTYGPVHSLAPVTAGQMVTGTISFYPYGSAIPAGMHRPRRSLVGGLALMGALCAGFAWRRRARRWFTVMVAATALVGLAAVNACAGGSLSSTTPATYQYTISADNESSGPTLLGQGVSTTISVTVP
jgi:hypothetical protein